MKKITVKQIRKLSLCYDPAEIPGVTEKTSWTLIDWLDYELAPAEDRVWIAIKFMTGKQNRIFAIWCARRIKTNNKHTKHFLDVAENYYINKTATKKELDIASRIAAYRVACGTAYGAAHLAAYRVAYEAAYWAANWAAYCAKYPKRERLAQIKKIKKILEEA